VSTEEQKEIDEREGGEPNATLGREPADTETDDKDTAYEASEHGDSDSDDGMASASGESDSDDDEDEDLAVSSEPSAVAAAKPSQAKAASAGARLAAAKAAKAAKKAAKKSRENAAAGPSGVDATKQSIDAIKSSSIGQAATQASEWAQTNRNLAVGIFSAIVLAALGWVGFGWWSTSQAQAAGSLLETAIEIANAEIRATPAEQESESASETPTFATQEERTQAALDAYRRVTQEYGGSHAAPWARLGEARALFELGQIEESRAAYEQALNEAGGDPMVAWRALEGIGFTYEVGEQWASAIEKYEELRTIEDGAYQGPADYHIARMRLANGETVQATTALRELVTRLREDGEEPAFPFVLAQAEIRLRELDPSSASSSSTPSLIGPGAGQLPEGLEGIDPQILEQLRRQLQQQGAGTGEGE
jgi:tetratricopeptide (TPR) repeat protein